MNEGEWSRRLRALEAERSRLRIVAALALVFSVLVPGGIRYLDRYRFVEAAGFIARDGAGNARVRIVSAAEGARVSIGDSAGRERVGLLGSDGGGSIVLMDKDNRVRLEGGVANSVAYLDMYGLKSGAPAIRVNTSERGVTVTLRDTAGRSRVEIAATEAGSGNEREGAIVVRSENGTVLWSMPQ